MAVTPYTKVSSASIAGLITDGNALINTEQSNLDESNYEMLRDGTRRRRRPIMQETKGEETFLGSSVGTLRGSYIWKTPSFKDDLSILCEENNGDISFYLLYHNDPHYMRAHPIPDTLRLELWGRRADTYTPDIEEPATYTEGNGSLYVFSPQSGTIKVELIDGNRLRMSPIGTWVRDYKGADEPQEMDYRIPQVAPLTTYGAYPFVETDGPTLTSEPGPERLYNLSNSGWDAQAITDFVVQSGTDVTVELPFIGNLTLIDNVPHWPATTDRYLSGRIVTDTAGEQFSFVQLNQSKGTSSLPPMGARICASEKGPGGTLVNRPTDMADNATLDFNDLASRFTLNVTFNNIQSNVNYAFLEHYAAFVHSFTFTAERDGKTYQGGISGVFNANIYDSGKRLQWWFFLPSIVNYTNVQIESLYMYPSPAHVPHVLNVNNHSYDYTGDGRRPTAGAFYAGRLFQTADNHSRIYFSQIVDVSTDRYTKAGINIESFCYSAADPTDGDDNALVATDGGYINTNDSGTHYGLVPLGDSLLLLTDNGIWAVRPGTTGAFTATNYRYEKVSSAEVLGVQAWVSTGDTIQIATDEGILTLSLESTSFGNTTVRVQRSLENRLLEGYSDILKQFPNPTGAYDPESRTIRWLFRARTDTEYDDDIGQPILTYSILHNAWYKYTVSPDSRIFHMITLPYTMQTETYNKYRYLIGGYKDTLETIYMTGWGVEVELGEEGLGEWVQDGLITGELFADFRPRSFDPDVFRDAPPAFMLTNHMLPGQAMQWSQLLYVIVHNRNVTETWRGIGNDEVRASVDGSTKLSVRWDWMDQNSTGKWSKPVETYRYRRNYLPTGNTEKNTYGEPVLVHKVKLRGRGREFRLYFESDGHKDSHIEGWAYQGYVLNGV